ncbi:MAG: hypothetical protein LBT40_09165, partial [Deltaproteobacteria bacterium]|nr:hypothetical protein [Deltaproteobacteria bacterium]
MATAQALSIGNMGNYRNQYATLSKILDSGTAWSCPLGEQLSASSTPPMPITGQGNMPYVNHFKNLDMTTDQDRSIISQYDMSSTTGSSTAWT